MKVRRERAGDRAAKVPVARVTCLGVCSVQIVPRGPMVVNRRMALLVILAPEASPRRPARRGRLLFQNKSGEPPL